MNFICQPCKDGADINAPEQFKLMLRRQYHDKCKGGTWCDCQHRVGKKNVV